ncbi:dTDP-4-dehydrorhamnose 3,5-epimerase [uncultured Amaricoccus sp.]|uniref:dTDP-4-dehydrorhamnose 3,5-epimerase n=1 Tax=uncultured Amaricoccus sp. TaxID=339341 RepID=UPI00262E39CA|nr:dTDP-4-dehydrorhamnose 3,5-epimerase [uncultured Amaricoccus sp.]
MDVRATAIPEVKLLSPRRFGDHRGYFCETWSAPRMAAAGLDVAFVQDNESLSAQVGTLRGLHFQAPPFAQAKLVRVARGAIRDVAVDVRRGSPTFGRWVAEELSAASAAQLLVPRGFLHGFVTLVPDTLVLYKVDNPYDAASDGGVAWNDPDLGVDWGWPADAVVLSDKDRAQPAFRAWESPFEYGVDA